jgi:hypothetical protein
MFRFFQNADSACPAKERSGGGVGDENVQYINRLNVVSGRLSVRSQEGSI